MPALSRLQRIRLGIGAPIILAIMARMMFRPSPQLLRQHHIPPEALYEAYHDNAEQRSETIASIRRVRKLCEDLGLLTHGYRRVWRVLGLET